MGNVTDKYSNNEDLSVIHQNKDVIINFYGNAIILVRKLAPYLEKHLLFRELIHGYQPIIIPEFEHEFEQKFAMLIALNVIKRKWYETICAITNSDVMIETNIILMDMINKSCTGIITEDSIEYLLDGYPIALLSDICRARKYHVHIIGESVKRFIIIRKKYPFLLPAELYNVIDSVVPLVGDDKSPLTQNELLALYRYLGTRKNIYIHTMLNCLFELSHKIEVFDNSSINEEDLIIIMKSSWLFLLLWTASYFRELESCDNYDADTESILPEILPYDTEISLNNCDYGLNIS